jgi:hypothetical protein
MECRLYVCLSHLCAPNPFSQRLFLNDRDERWRDSVNVAGREVDKAEESVASVHSLMAHFTDKKDSLNVHPA